jgi:predicted site-specific integrase-resolvase
MSDRWLSIAEAAERVGKSVRTIKAWRQRGEITVLVGRVRESDVVEADKRMRERMHAGVRPADGDPLHPSAR